MFYEPAGDSGERINQIVRRRFDQSAYVALRRISCEYSRGVVRLSGQVPRFYLKQVALSMVEDLGPMGVTKIEDDVRVED